MKGSKLFYEEEQYNTKEKCSYLNKKHLQQPISETHPRPDYHQTPNLI